MKFWEKQKIIKMEYKEPNKVICGICAGYIGESDNPEGELGYDGCESFEDSLDSYINR